MLIQLSEVVVVAVGMNAVPSFLSVWARSWDVPKLCSVLEASSAARVRWTARRRGHFEKSTVSAWSVSTMCPAVHAGDAGSRALMLLLRRLAFSQLCAWKSLTIVCFILHCSFLYHLAVKLVASHITGDITTAAFCVHHSYYLSSD